MELFKCPLSHFVLADALGLIAIHVNRVVRQLREVNLLTLRRGATVKIHDLAPAETTGLPGRLSERACD
jgi:hypothetical protein